jgi:hypothetical protein
MSREDDEDEEGEDHIKVHEIKFGDFGIMDDGKAVSTAEKKAKDDGKTAAGGKTWNRLLL